MNRVVIPFELFEETSTLLVEYEVFEGDFGFYSIRLCRQACQAGQCHYLPDGTWIYGPVWEATWLYGVPGVNSLLTHKQLRHIEKLVCIKDLSWLGEVSDLPLDIPENQILTRSPQ